MGKHNAFPSFASIYGYAEPITSTPSLIACKISFGVVNPFTATRSGASVIEEELNEAGVVELMFDITSRSNEYFRAMMLSVRSAGLSPNPSPPIAAPARIEW